MRKWTNGGSKPAGNGENRYNKFRHNGRLPRQRNENENGNGEAAVISGKFNGYTSEVLKNAQAGQVVKYIHEIIIFLEQNVVSREGIVWLKNGVRKEKFLAVQNNENYQQIVPADVTVKGNDRLYCDARDLYNLIEPNIDSIIRCEKLSSHSAHPKLTRAEFRNNVGNNELNQDIINKCQAIRKIYGKLCIALGERNELSSQKNGFQART